MSEPDTGLPGEGLLELDLADGIPAEASARRLYEEMLFQRAVQAFALTLPAVNVIAMRDASEKQFGAGYHVLPVWKDRMDARCKVTTPNADVIYAMSYLDLKKDGPLVVQAPPKVLGLFTDFWQRCLSDVGPSGPDAGQGGDYLLLPPDHQGPVPGGYHVVRSTTYHVFLFWRTVLVPGDDGPDTAPGVAIIEQTRIFPLRSREQDRPAMQFPNASGVELDMLFPRDGTYFDKLARFVQDEPIGMTDMVTRGMLATLGIIKGHPFQPDERLRAILDRAGRIAPRMVLSIPQTDALPNAFYYDSGYWRACFGGVDEDFHTATYLDVDSRAAFFIWAYSTSPAMVGPFVGHGSKYPFSLRDANGDQLTGGRSYRLHVPADVPAALYWAATLYNADDASMIDNGRPFPSVNSLDTLTYNTDGSLDLYFGPTRPEGAADANWIPTLAGRAFFILFRLYGPTQPFFDQTWRLPEIEPLT
ncbi:DUF1254 domain-containing protein [Streptomyces sp. NBC_00669]|uniref:DUF1254 domain-containing protein n=1 Tax=unclassified Streptomyces TaxID=2593676 RepID=UPI002E327160|nr:DUF1254 domain-containing protein [Streptomyces sp. NBC_00669]